MPVTYTISYPTATDPTTGKVIIAPISKNAAKVIEAAIAAIAGYDDKALETLDGKTPGIPPLIGPCQAGALLVKDQVARNKSAALLLKPKATQSTLTKPSGGAVAATE